MDAAVLSWVLAAHILGFVLWIGGLCGLTLLLSSTPGQVALARGGKRIAMVADLGATLAIAAGVVMIAGIKPSPMTQGWMHIKLAVVVGLIAVHGFARVKLKRAQSAEGATVSPLWPAAVIAVAAAIIILATVRPL
ncbi:MAG TPA: hypothetical protein VFG83_06310 [Kofleriaceae bacterium]|nr:hypothetical protein [Kofleriaceae bacterium]